MIVFLFPIRPTIGFGLITIRKAAELAKVSKNHPFAFPKWSYQGHPDCYWHSDIPVTPSAKLQIFAPSNASVWKLTHRESLIEYFDASVPSELSISVPWHTVILE